MSSILFDGILLLIILLGALIGYKRGGMHIIFSFASLLISAYLSYVLLNPVTDFVSKLIFSDNIDIKKLLIVKAFVLLSLFLILSIVLGIVVKLINKIFSVSIIGKLNKVLGAILGALCGAVIVYILCYAVSLMLKNDIKLPIGITAQIIDDSILYRLFM